ncbi:MAG: hypothetical protein AAFV53_20200 [Myxococcota bacterium]
MTTIALFALLTGCAPQDAEVNAHWFTWLAANSSPAVAEGEFDDMFAEQATAIECSGRGWDRDRDGFADGYIGPGNSIRGAAEYIGGDCNPNDDSCDDDALVAACQPFNDIYYHTFITEDGVYRMDGEYDDYRSEAYINGEGDFQLTVHMQMDNREDFRFHFSIDPDFQPVTCISNENGEAEIVRFDDASWLEEWSTDEDDYTIYYLNANSFQINPGGDADSFWFLVPDYMSGFGEAKFGPEEFSTVPVSFGDYDHFDDYEDGSREPLLANGPHFLGVANRENPDLGRYDAFVNDMLGYADAWSTEMSDVIGAQTEGYTFEHKIEDNRWREIDISTSGFDGWMELHSSWVKIRNSSSFEEGGSVEGEYQIFYQGIESNSRLLVKGDFKVDDLREDFWAYPFLEDVKRDENGNPFCDGAPFPE